MNISMNVLRLLELLLNCDGVGEIDVDFSASDGFFCNLFALAFNCSCCRVCKFLLVSCMAMVATGCKLPAGDALCVDDTETGFKGASFVTACGAERVMHT